MSEQMLADPEATISLSGTVALLEQAALRLAVPDFGLRLGQRQDLSVLGPIALVARRADTVGNALAAIARNLPYHVTRASLSLKGADADGNAWLSYELPPGVGQAQRQAVEMCQLLVVQTLRMLSGGDRRQLAGSAGARARHGPRALSGRVRLRRRLQSARQRRIFSRGCPGPPGRWQQPADSRRRRALREPPDPAQRARPGLLIEELIARPLVNGGCNLAEIARQLTMHERTLQRRLDAQHVRFADILDRVRKKQAREFLHQRALPLPEVAILLG